MFFHLSLLCTSSSLSTGKNFNRFSNMNAGFLEKRRLALDVYLNTILGADVLRKFIGSMEIIEVFLSAKWDKAIASGSITFILK